MRIGSWFTRKTVWLVLLLSALTCGQSIYAQSKTQFRWIDPQRDHTLWDQIRQAFQDELKPDAPDPDTETSGYKYLKQAGITGNSALVIVGYRKSEHLSPDEKDSEYFRAFNYDLAHGSISKIISPENNDPIMMWGWKYFRLAHFESLDVPEVLFTYLTCWECEPEKMLSALHYDPTLRQWRIRTWGNGKPYWWMTPVGLVVWKDIYGGDDTVSYDCVYGSAALKHDGFDNLAIRCREVSEPTKNKFQVEDATVLYSLQQGHFASEVVTDKKERLKILSELCVANGKNKLCRGAKTP